MDIIIGIAMSIMSAFSFNGSTTVNVDGTNYVLGGPVHTFQNYQDGGDGELSQDDNVSLIDYTWRELYDWKLQTEAEKASVWFK